MDTIKLYGATLFTDTLKNEHIGFCRLIYIKHGLLKLFSGGNTYILRPGEGILLFPGCGCTFESGSFEGFEVCFERQANEELTFENSPVCFSIKAGPRSIFRKECNSLYTLLTNASPESAEHQYNAVSAALSLYKGYFKAFSKNYTLRYNRTASLAKAYIDNNYTRSITVYDVADNSGVSVSELAKRFVKAFSVSPGQYILSRRVNLARELLKTTHLTSREIGLSVGFSHPSAFNKIFKKNTGMTPLEYRRSV